MYPGDSGKEGDPASPTDFAVDLDGNLWILDVVNQRVSKYSSQGEFLFGWNIRPGWRSVGSRLEVDGQRRVYVYCAKGDTSEVVVLDYSGQQVASVILPINDYSDFHFRVTGTGAMFQFDGLDCIRLAGEKRDSLRVYDFYTSAFSDSILIGMAPAQRDSLIFEWFSVPEIHPGKGRRVAVPRAPVEDTHTSVATTDREGWMFVLAAGYHTKEGVSAVFVHDCAGRAVGQVPECPKERFATNAGSGDDFSVDAQGSLYQLQVIPSWVRKRTRSNDYVQVWKWTRWH